MLNIFILLAIQAIVLDGLKLTVYYTSWDQKSRKFITNHLYNAYEHIDIDIEFVPFGPSKLTTNPWKLECEQGMKECHTNLIHACALQHIKDSEDQVDFIACIMKSNHPLPGGPKCAKRLLLDYKPIEKCASGQEGKDLAKFLSRMTAAYGTKRFPSIAINEVPQTGEPNKLKLAPIICRKEPDILGCGSFHGESTGLDKKYGRLKQRRRTRYQRLKRLLAGLESSEG